MRGHYELLISPTVLVVLISAESKDYWQLCCMSDGIYRLTGSSQHLRWGITFYFFERGRVGQNGQMSLRKKGEKVKQKQKAGKKVSAQFKRPFLSLCEQKLKLLFSRWLSSRCYNSHFLPQWPQGAGVIERGKIPVSMLPCSAHHSKGSPGSTEGHHLWQGHWCPQVLAVVVPVHSAGRRAFLVQRGENLHMGARLVRKDTANTTGRLWLGHWFIGTYEAPRKCPNYMGGLL